MDTSRHRILRAGSPVAIIRRRNGKETEAEGIVDCTAADSSIGVRLAGSPGYSDDERVVLVDFSEDTPWAADATFVVQSGGAAYFRRTASWYRYESSGAAGCKTNIRVTVTSLSGAYLERGIAIEMSECGLRIFVPSEPEDRELRVLMPGERDGITLPCRLLGTSYRDDGVELRVAFHELDLPQSRYVTRLTNELRIVAERGRNLIDTR